jgi:hypothetical protein
LEASTEIETGGTYQYPGAHRRPESAPLLAGRISTAPGLNDALSGLGLVEDSVLLCPTPLPDNFHVKVPVTAAGGRIRMSVDASETGSELGLPITTTGEVSSTINAAGSVKALASVDSNVILNGPGLPPRIIFKDFDDAEFDH